LRRKIFIILRQAKSSREIDLLCISGVIMSHANSKNAWQNEDKIFFKIRQIQNHSLIAPKRLCLTNLEKVFIHKGISNLYQQ
jgi:hypothetical protein